jgi:hypothetical protein
VPSADLLASGKFVIDADLVWGALDSFSISSPLSVQRVHAGLSEWVNMDVGYVGGFTMGLKANNAREYAGGFTMGFKANLIKEVEESYIPSITIGAQNLFHSREALYFGGPEGYPGNDFYFAAAKSSEWAKLRVHAGLIASLDYTYNSDRYSPFVGLEKYFGKGLYMTAELERRAGEFVFSIFAVYRVVSDMVEINVGVIDAPGVSRQPDPDKIIRPSIRGGIKAYLGSGYNTFDGMKGVEDRVDRYRDTVRSLSKRLDSLETETRWNAERIHALAGFPDHELREERVHVMDELAKLRVMYDQEPFDPELVRNTLDGIMIRKERVAPHLRVAVVDPDTPRRLRTLAVSLLGEMKDTASANILMSVLTRFEDPSLKIDAMVALGKIGETRCGPILKTLRNDPDGGVAFTAAEIYRSLFGEDDKHGESPALPEAPVGDDTVPERRLKR